MKWISKINIISFILGAIIFGGISGVVALTIASKDVSYDNTTSGAAKANVQEAIDELYVKFANYKKLDVQTTAGASHILSGKTAYNTNGQLITGTYTIPSTYKNLTTQTTASASHILSGKTAYNTNGQLITGTYTIPVIKYEALFSYGAEQNTVDNGSYSTSYTTTKYCEYLIINTATHAWANTSTTTTFDAKRIFTYKSGWRLGAGTDIYYKVSSGSRITMAYSNTRSSWHILCGNY